MRACIPVSVALFASLLTAAQARGADTQASAPKDEPLAESSVGLPDKEVKVGGEIVGESTGGATGFVFKQGFYTQSDLGVFFRLGGFTIGEECLPERTPCVPVEISNGQPYIGLSAGYDLWSWLGVQASFGTGFVANAAHYGTSDNNPRDYGLTFADLGFVAQYYVDRVALAVKVSGGALLVTPAPAPGEPDFGFNAIIGVGVRYATLLPDTFVGIDGNFHAALLPDSGGTMQLIPGFSFAPVIKYVF